MVAPRLRPASRLTASPPPPVRPPSARDADVPVLARPRCRWRRHSGRSFGGVVRRGDHPRSDSSPVSESGGATHVASTYRRIRAWCLIERPPLREAHRWLLRAGRTTSSNSPRRGRPPLDSAEELHARAYQRVRASAIVELGSSSPFDQTADEVGSAQVNDRFVLLDSPGETRSTCAAVNETTAIRRAIAALPDA